MESYTAAVWGSFTQSGFDVSDETQFDAAVSGYNFDPDRFVSDFGGASTSAYLFGSGLNWSDLVDSGELISDVLGATGSNEIMGRFRVALMETEGFNPNPNAVVPASESAIQGLEKVTLDDNRRSEFKSEQCSICLDGFFDQDYDGDDDDVQRPTKKRKTDDGQDHHQPQPSITITRLPCLHHYHTPCIVQWLQISHMCPLCRFPMSGSATSPSS